jgi:hypothetical protein
MHVLIRHNTTLPRWDCIGTLRSLYKEEGGVGPACLRERGMRGEGGPAGCKWAAGKKRIRREDGLGAGRTGLDRFGFFSFSFFTLFKTNF